MKLNLGCGADVREGWTNVDWIFPKGQPGDVVHWNLDDTPLPFPSDSVDEIYCSHILEHLWEWENLVLDCHRMLKPGGLLTIRVPYGFYPVSGHKRFFIPQTLDYYLAGGTMRKGVTGFEESTNDKRVDFKLISRTIVRRLPFQWHIRKYLRWNVPHDFPIGFKWEIRWDLQKPSLWRD